MIATLADNLTSPEKAQLWLIAEARKSSENRAIIFKILGDWQYADSPEHFLSFYTDIYQIAIAEKFLELKGIE